MADVIRTCSAPCLKRISREKYLENFDEACEFLDGKRPEVLEELKEKMAEAAAKKDFESAAKIRDTFFALKEMTKAHFVRKSPQMRREDALKGIEELAEVIGLKKPPRTIECVDISNLFGTFNVASLVVARDGLPDKRYYRHFRIKSFEGADDPRAMAEVAYRRYGPD
jgi:excinuclease ABC subunit C